MVCLRVRVVATLFLLLPITSIAKKLDFIEIDFDKFMSRIIENDEEQRKFKVYYANLSNKLRESDQEKKDRTYTYLYHLALDRLKVKHQDWFDALAPLITDPRYTLSLKFDETRKLVKFFLTRYGAYEEYLNMKSSIDKKQLVKNEESKTSDGIAPSSWQVFKNYAGRKIADASSAVSSWFGFSRNQQTVA